jgi:molybdopterin synthase catalytic subunit
MKTSCLIEGPISNETISAIIGNLGSDTSSGGHSVFLGQVRADIISGKKVRAIEYSAYREMTDIESARIISQILMEYDDVRKIEIKHSTGLVKAGEISLLIVVSSGHRKHAIEACSKTTELVKERLPVWKKEIFDDDTHEWK